MKILTREQWLNSAIAEIAPDFESLGFRVPTNIRVTCGWPSKSAGRSSKRRIGECWSEKASEDKTIEIIISMVLANHTEVLETLVHELIHAIDHNKNGHKGPFRTMALAIGLEGKMTATIAGEKLKVRLEEINKKLGDYPHAKIDFSSRKKQTTRMVKIECLDDIDCGMIFRTSRKWIDKALDEDKTFLCPACQAITKYS